MTRIFMLTVLLLVMQSAESQAFDHVSHPFGAGIYVGGNNNANWSGLHAKYWQSQTEALDFALSYNLRDNFGMGLQSDYLVHQFDWIKPGKLKVPVYYGGGAWLSFWTWEEGPANNRTNKADFSLGVRIPIGIAIHPTDIRFEPFIELAPSISVLPSTDFDISMILGLHYYF